MLENFVPREMHEDIEEYLSFAMDDTSGYAFRLTEDHAGLLIHDINGNEITWNGDPAEIGANFCITPSIQSLAYALFGMVWDDVYIHTIEHVWYEDAHGTCDCGEEVYLYNDYGHGIDCQCGRIYNMSGQELAPRSQWEDYYDEDSSQPYNVEFGYAREDY